MDDILLEKRHIQDFDNASGLEPHWGYVSRVLPCTNDAGSCAYLNQVYQGHDLSMKYTFIMWGVILGVLAIWSIGRLLKAMTNSRASASSAAARRGNILSRLGDAVGATGRKYLLPESIGAQIFGRVSRLQVLVLAIIAGYLIVFTFIGMTYQKWVTPVKNSTEFNTRSTLGPWSDRIGALSYALTPFAVALGTRESLLSLLTGISHSKFQFLHIWLGRIIYVQSALHTIGWTIIEAQLYRPQPTVYRMFIMQQYAIFGCVAMLLITFLFVFSLKSVIRRTGYEFFRKTHYIVAVLYIGACWGHWYQLACWMIASFGIYGIDRAVRLLRTLAIHFGRGDAAQGIGFRPAQSSVRLFEDEETSVVRVEFEHRHSAWKIGQHFYLCFPSLTIWQSHPMTPASLPSTSGMQKHISIIRAHKGETGRLAALCRDDERKSIATPVILTGPSGCGIAPAANVLAIAGGTGISFILPVFTAALEQARLVNHGVIHLVWVVRRLSNLEWIAAELAELRAILVEKTYGNCDVKVKVFITRESSRASSLSGSSVEEVNIDIGNEKAGAATSAKNPVAVTLTRSLAESMDHYSVEYLSSRHPELLAHSRVLEDWVQATAAYGGRCEVVASGPAGMGSDLRVAVSKLNDPSRAWRGEGGSVGFHWDNRMG